MPTYDGQNFQPPAAVPAVSLRDPQFGKVVADVNVLIDSGADVTLLPSDAINQLGIELDPKSQCEVAGFDGKRSMAAAVDLDLLFTETIVSGRYLVTGAAIGILARNVLNFFVTTLNGLAGE